MSPSLEAVPLSWLVTHLRVVQMLLTDRRAHNPNSMMQAADLIFGPVAAQHDYQHAIFFRLFAGFLELVALQNWVLKVITPACSMKVLACAKFINSRMSSLHAGYSACLSKYEDCKTQLSS